MRAPSKGISDDDWSFVLKHLRRLLNRDVRVYFFGSRMRETHKAYSDLDLCLEADEKIEPSILYALEEVFADSDLPYKVDILEFNSIDKDFQEHIKENSIKIEL